METRCGRGWGSGGEGIVGRRTALAKTPKRNRVAVSGLGTASPWNCRLSMTASWLLGPGRWRIVMRKGKAWVAGAVLALPWVRCPANNQTWSQISRHQLPRHFWTGQNLPPIETCRVQGKESCTSQSDNGSQENEGEAERTGNTSEGPKRGSGPVSVPLPRIGNTLHSPSLWQLSLSPYLKPSNLGPRPPGPWTLAFEVSPGRWVLGTFRG